jgi:hypothetical protein
MLHATAKRKVAAITPATTQRIMMLSVTVVSIFAIASVYVRFCQLSGNFGFSFSQLREIHESSVLRRKKKDAVRNAAATMTMIVA